MCMTNLPSFIRFAIVLSLSLCVFVIQANERARFSGESTPIAYQINNSAYTLYVRPLGSQGMIYMMLTPTIPTWDPNNTNKTMTVNKPSLIFRGTCAPASKIHVVLTQIDTPELKSFEASANIIDFPYQTELDMVSKELAFQCPQMQNITVTATGDNLHKNIQRWQASLLSSNNWQLEAYNPSITGSDAVSVSFRSHQAGAQYQLINYNIGADYTGLCADEVAVTLSVFPSTDNGSGAPTLANYEWTSGNVTPLLLQNCPNLKKINYTMDPLPSEYNCTENCDVYASVASRWSFETGHIINYVDKAQGNMPERLQSYAEIIKALTVENPKVVISSVLFQSFYHRYLNHYSSACQAFIEDPVPFQYTVTTTTSDGYGNELSSDKDTLNRITYVEKAYAEKFDQYYSASNAKALGDIFGSVLSGRAPNASNMAYSLMREDEEIIKHIKKGCTSQAVKRVYGNLFNLANL